MAVERSGRDDRLDILCDLGRSRLILGLAEDGTLMSELQEWPTERFANQARPLAAAVREFATSKGIAIEGRKLILSAPIYINSDAIKPQGMPGDWTFDRAAMRAELGLSGFDVMNDMVALGHAVPIISEQGAYKLIGKGRPKIGFPVVAIGVRSGLGAVGFVKARENPHWIPVQTESGHIGITPATPDEHTIMHFVREERGDLPLTITGQDLLSGMGAPSLIRAVARLEFEGGHNPDPVRAEVAARELTSANLSKYAVGDGDAAHVARQAIAHWCAFFGSFARNMALAFGAMGGLFVTGKVAADFLADGKKENHSTFRKNFEIGGTDDHYLRDIPTMLITHEYPYLAGLARFSGVDRD